MRRVLLSAVMLFAVLVPFASAQTNCPAAPVIVQTYGTNPMCFGAYASFDAGPGWTTYTWSNGSHERTWAENPVASESLTVTVTDGNGCQLTSQPFQVTVLDSPPNRTIHVTPDDPTPGSAVHAWVDAAGSTNAFQWQIYNGTPTGPIDGTSVDFTAGQSGGIGIYVTETAPNGCTGGGMTSVQINTAEPVTIATSTTAMCTNGHATASVSGWESVSWTITNGSFVTNSYPYFSTTTNGPSVEFSASGAGDVRLVVDTFSMSGMRSGHGSATVALQQPGSLPLTADADVCPMGVGNASVAQGDWQSFWWTISHGSFEIPDYPYIAQTAYGANVRFHPDGSGPVGLSVTAQNGSMCTGSATATVNLRTIAAPAIITDGDICPMGRGNASVAPPAGGGSWQGVYWTISNGFFETPDYPFQSSNVYGTNVRYGSTAPHDQPITLTANVYDGSMCNAQSTATVNLRTIAAPAITTDGDICPMGRGNASVAPPAGGGSWQGVSWTISNGFFETPDYPFQSTYASGTNVRYGSTAPHDQPITLTANVYDGSMCNAQSTATVNLRTIAAPAITTDGDICPMGRGNASIAPPAGGGSWSVVYWTITNGTFEVPEYPYQSTYANGPNVRYWSNAPHDSAITLTAWVYDTSMCTAQATATVNIGTIAPPVINADADICTMGTGHASVVGGDWNQVYWSIANGSFSGAGPNESGTHAWGNSVQFNAQDGNGAPIVLTAHGYDEAGCDAEATTTVNRRTIPPPTIDLASPSLCPNGAYTQASVANASQYATFEWTVLYGTISGGGIPEQPNGPSVSVKASGTTPVQLSVTVTDFSGCRASQSVMIPIRTLAAPTIDVASPSLCPNGTYTQASVANASEYATFEWTVLYGTISGGGGQQPNGPSVYVNASGTTPVQLSVTVTDFNGCRASQSVMIPIRTLAAPTIDVASPSLCPNGTYTQASVANASNYASFEWSIVYGTISGAPPQQMNGPSVYVNASGTNPVQLSVTVTDFNGCRASQSVMIPIRTLAAPTIDVASPSLCPNGTYTQASVANASDYANFEWSVVNGNISMGYGSSGPTIYFNASGNEPVQVSVTVTDFNGCRASSQSVTVPIRTLAAPTVNLSSPTVCASGNSTQAGVANPADYASVSWSIANGTLSGSPNDSSVYFHATGSDPVQLGVTVVDFNGCTASTSVSVPVAAAPDATINVGPYNQYNLTTGSQAVMAGSISSGGTYDYCGSADLRLTAPLAIGNSYQWSTGSSSPSIHVTESGTYSVTVTNAGGCMSSDSVTIAIHPVPAAPTVTSSRPSLCPNGSVTLTASDADGWLWSTGAQTRSIVVTSPGQYTVRAIVAGCQSALSAPLTLDLDTVSINASATGFCPGGSATLTATAGASYHWSNDATTQSIVVTTAGTYSVTVTSADGCSITSAPVTITTSSLAVSVTPSSAVTTCSDTPATLTASATGGTGGYSYQWFNAAGPIAGGTGASFVATAIGTDLYHVVVTDSAGCTVSSAAASVTNNAAPAGTLSTYSALCPNEVYYAQVYGTAPQSTLDWSVTNGAIVSTSGYLTYRAGASGSVVVTVTEHLNGCSKTSSVTVPIRVAPNATVTANGPTTFCAGGSVTLTAPVNAQYNWSNGASTQSITVTTSGDYWVTVRSDEGCPTTSAPVTVTVTPLPDATITASGSTTLCAGSSVTLSAPAGVTANWFRDGGFVSSQASITTSTVGTYELRTSANGCTNSSSVNVTRDTSLNASISGTGTICWQNETGWYQFDGTAASYSWTLANGAIVNGQGTNRVTFTPAAGASSIHLTLVVTSAVGCSETREADVTVNRPVTSISASGPTTFCAGGSVTLTASGNYFGYTWSNGQNGSSITVTQPGTYSVHAIADPNTCAGPESAAVVVSTNARPTATVSGSSAICAGSSATISATLTGTAPFSVTWSDGATQSGISTTSVTRSVSPSNNTTYTITAVSDASCSGSASGSAVVTVNARPTATVTGTTAICAGSSATISATLTGTAPFSVTWSDGAIQSGINATSVTRSVSPSNNTTYTITAVSDASCSGSASGSATVTVKARPTAVVTGTAAICAGSSTTISATLTGTAPFSVTWSDGATQSGINATSVTRSVSPSNNTTYTITAVSDASCSGSASGSATITVKARPTAVVSGNSSGCPSTSRTIQATLTGTAPFSVTWSDGAVQSGINTTSVSRTVSPASTTTYTITAVGDAGGCSGTSSGSAVVTVAAAPSITQQPTNLTTTRNTTVTFHVVAAPAGVHYQWQTLNGSTWSAASGATATTADYQTSQGKRGTFSYRVIVSDDCSRSVTSNVVTLTVN